MNHSSGIWPLGSQIIKPYKPTNNQLSAYLSVVKAKLVGFTHPLKI